MLHSCTTITTPKMLLEPAIQIMTHYREPLDDIATDFVKKNN